MRPPVIVTVVQVTDTKVIARGRTGGTWTIPVKLAVPEELERMVPGTVCELSRQRPKTLRIQKGT